MNLTTLIQKKETLFDNKKFTKALDYIFGGDFNNKANIDEHGRLIIQYKDKNKGCVVFKLDNRIETEPYIEARICKTKNPSEGLEFFYQTQTIKTTAMLGQFKKFLVSVLWIHFYILKMVETNHQIGKEIVKLGRLEKQIK